MTRLTLLGRGSSKKDCYFNSETWATATILLEPGWQDKPYSKLFLTDWEPAPLVAEVMSIAASYKYPVISPHSHRIPGTEPYPTFSVIERFHSNYFKNTASYMIALALYEGYNKLELFGIDQIDPEYLVHRSYVSFWLGVATGLGVSYKLGGESMDWFWAGGEKKKKYMEVTSG